MKNKSICYGRLMLFAVSVWAASAQAQSYQWSCSYTQVLYNAPFMAEEQSRECPEGRCNYAISYDQQSAQGQVNGVTGYQLETKGERITLFRSQANTIVGGRDSARFIIDTQSGDFVSIKTTSPEVTLTARGRCQAD